MPRRVLASIVVSALLALGGEAWGQANDLASGRSALTSHAWSSAVEAFERVVQSRTAHLEQLIEAHRGLAWARQMMGDAPASEREATLALALDPRVQLPENAPAELRATFDRVRSQRQGARIQIDVDLEGALIGRRSATLHLRVSGLPAGETVRVGARCTSASREVASAHLPTVGDGQYDVPVEALETGARLDCEAQMATSTGVTIDRRALHRVAESQRAVLAPGERAPNGWLIAGIVTGAVAIAAVVVVGFALSGGSDVAHLGTPTVMGP